MADEEVHGPSAPGGPGSTSTYFSRAYESFSFFGQVFPGAWYSLDAPITAILQRIDLPGGEYVVGLSWESLKRSFSLTRFCVPVLSRAESPATALIPASDRGRDVDLDASAVEFDEKGQFCESIYFGTWCSEK